MFCSRLNSSKAKYVFWGVQILFYLNEHERSLSVTNDYLPWLITLAWKRYLMVFLLFRGKERRGLGRKKDRMNYRQVDKISLLFIIFSVI